MWEGKGTPQDWVGGISDETALAYPLTWDMLTMSGRGSYSRGAGCGVPLAELDEGHERVLQRSTLENALAHAAGALLWTLSCS